MNHWLLLVLSVLACYRLSYMLANELGPFDIFRRMRELPKPKSNLSKGVHCSLCWSVWISFLINSYLLWLGFISWPESPLWSFGITGAAVLMHKLDN